ncbi:Transcriptional regulator, AcrR family [hydrothermal vent metagenome]|uniref:Transcriptional regulator, AcrR family n=1 Tax=hydrothermal vent metagenome TaxID=652676 RepID=A0A3B0QY54_9ZZZZ
MSSKNIDTRKRILMASWDLLVTEQGCDARMSDIARRAGVSRQALYLHFKSRAELLFATVLYIDDEKGATARLEVCRAAKTGRERLEAFIDAWGNYIPEIYGVAKALLAARESDPAAAEAWDDRMHTVRAECEAAVTALSQDGRLSPDFTIERATDTLWTLLSVRNWEQLTRDCGWSQEDYIKNMKHNARVLLVK